MGAHLFASIRKDLVVIEGSGEEKELVLSLAVVKATAGVAGWEVSLLLGTDPG